MLLRGNCQGNWRTANFSKNDNKRRVWEEVNNSILVVRVPSLASCIYTIIEFLLYYFVTHYGPQCSIRRTGTTVMCLYGVEILRVSYFPPLDSIETNSNRQDFHFSACQLFSGGRHF